MAIITFKRKGTNFFNFHSLNPRQQSIQKDTTSSIHLWTTHATHKALWLSPALSWLWLALSLSGPVWLSLSMALFGSPELSLALFSSLWLPSALSGWQRHFCASTHSSSLMLADCVLMQLSTALVLTSLNFSMLASGPLILNLAGACGSVNT